MISVDEIQNLREYGTVIIYIGYHFFLDFKPFFNPSFDDEQIILLNQLDVHNFNQSHQQDICRQCLTKFLCFYQSYERNRLIR